MRVLLLADGSAPATDASHLADQVRALGHDPVPVLGGDEALAALADHSGPVALLPAGLVAHDRPLAGLLGGTTSAVVGPADHPAARPTDAIRTAYGDVVDAGSPVHPHPPTGTVLLGGLRLAGDDLDRIRPQLAELRDLLATQRQAGAGDDPTALLVVALLRAGADVRGRAIRGFLWHQPPTAERAADAQRRRTPEDEEAARLAASVKANDGWFTTHLVSPYSRYLARWFARRGATPDQVTSLSMLVGLLSAGAFAVGTRPWLIAGAVLVQLSFTLDCVDGQLARYSGRSSAVGAWLDGMFDRTKEYAAYAGLAIGAVRTGTGDEVWLLAGAALALQSVRHLMDLGYGAAELERLHVAVRHPVTAGVLGPAEVAAHVEAATTAAGPAAASAAEPRWARRIVILPIGERLALTSILAATTSATVVFGVLLVWGVVATLYMTAGRVVRSVTRRSA